MILLLLSFSTEEKKRICLFINNVSAALENRDFSLELLSTEEIVPINTAFSMFVVHNLRIDSDF